MSDWTPEMDNELITKVRQGVAFQKIADLLGKTRNSIAGRKYRLSRDGVEMPLFDGGSRERITPKKRAAKLSAMRAARKPSTPKPRKEARTMAIPLVTEDAEGVKLVRGADGRARPTIKAALPVVEGAMTMRDLRRGQCRAPVGEATGADQLFCAQPAGDGSYCDTHHRVMYRKETAKSRKRFLAGVVAPPRSSN